MLVNLREPLAVLRRHLWMVLGITALVTAVIGYRAYIAVPTYRAAAVIRLSNPRHALTGGVAEGPSAGIDARSADPLLSQVELIQSRTVAAVVVDSMPILRIRTVPFARSLLRDVALADTIKVDSLVLQFGPDSLVVTGRAEQVRTIYGAPVELDGIRFSVAARPQAPTGVLRLVSREAALGRVIGGLQVTPRPRTDVIDVAYSATDPTHAQQVANRVVQV